MKEMTKLEKLCIKWLNDNYNPMEPFIMEEYTDYIFHMKDGKCILQHNKKNGYVYVHYKEIWSFFEHIFSMSSEQIKDITKIWVEEHYKMEIFSIGLSFGTRWSQVEKYYKMGITTTGNFYDGIVHKVEEIYKTNITTTKDQNDFYFNRDVEELYKKKQMDKGITTFINQPIETTFEKPDFNSWKYYSNLLPLSKEIYLEMFGEPKTHAEWAESFNKIGRINRLIIKHANGGNNNKNS